MLLVYEFTILFIIILKCSLSTYFKKLVVKSSQIGPKEGIAEEGTVIIGHDSCLRATALKTFQWKKTWRCNPAQALANMCVSSFLTKHFKIKTNKNEKKSLNRDVKKENILYSYENVLEF